MPQPHQQRSDGENGNWGRYVGIGLEIAVGVALGYVVGAFLDSRFGWTPWGVVVGTMLGLAGGLYLLIKEALRMNRQ
ncbi:AtpZ/AtpI family protein [Fontivita pretiosa]|uniref:AtpZ/AtpI family protein n=1 Tax=Fontivita pretiosa TaxID=2989684 RepID=UPI003D183035